MTKTSRATLNAISKYNKKSKTISLKFTENQLSEYDRIINYCRDNGLSYQGYIKALIKKDLDQKEDIKMIYDLNISKELYGIIKDYCYEMEINMNTFVIDAIIEKFNNEDEVFGREVSEDGWID